MNPIDAHFNKPILWHYKPEGEINRQPLKCGSRAGTTLRRARLPRFSSNQRIAFGILCCRQLPQAKAWSEWADNWWAGKDRSRTAAWAARAAVMEARWAGATEAWVAVTEAAAWAAAMKEEAAWAANWAAEAAARGKIHIDFIALAKQAYEFERKRNRSTAA